MPRRVLPWGLCTFAPSLHLQSSPCISPHCFLRSVVCSYFKVFEGLRPFGNMFYKTAPFFHPLAFPPLGHSPVSDIFYNLFVYCLPQPTTISRTLIPRGQGCSVLCIAVFKMPRTLPGTECTLILAMSPWKSEPKVKHVWSCF